MKRILLILLSITLILSCKDERTGSERALETLSIYLLSRPDLLRPNFCEPPQLILEEGQTYNITLEEGKRFWFKFSANTDTVGIINKKIRLTVIHSSGTNFRLNGISCSNPIDESSQGIVPKSSNGSQTIYELTINSSNISNTLLLTSGDINFTMNYVLF